MKIEKQLLIENIKEYAIILDDYINKKFIYTLNTECLEDEIKTIWIYVKFLDTIFRDFVICRVLHI